MKFLQAYDHRQTKCNKRTYSLMWSKVMARLNPIAPKNASALWALVFFLFSLGATSCHLYEYPDPDCFRPLRLSLQFDTDFTDWYYDFQSQDEPVTGDTSPLALDGEMTYYIHAYHMENGNVKRDNYEEYTFTREVEGNYDVDTTIDLAPGDYYVMVWADFRIDGKSYYYYSNDFAAIAVETNPYTGNTDYRDAFMGTLQISVKEEGESSGTVLMSRPLGKYEFIATNAADFLAKQSETNGREMTLQDYYIVFRYPDYVPTQFNMFNRRGSDAKAGLMYNSFMSTLGNGETSLGFDYVFANEGGTYITVYGNVYAKADGKLVASTPQIRLPLRPSFRTILKGEFLDVRRNDGVGIDPGYEGEFNIPGTITPSN